MNTTANSRPASSASDKTILLVEDDDCMREDLAFALRKRGYCLIEACDAVSALDALRSNQRVDLLFTDIVLPSQMNGRALAAEAQTIVPDLPVLFTSGYSPDVVFPQAAQARRAYFLQKPYSRQLLFDKLDAAFAG